MACLQADDGQVESFEAVVEPGCQEAGLQSNPHEVGRITTKRCGECLWITRPLATPDGVAGVINNMDGGLLIGDVEGSIVRHGTLQRLIETRSSDLIADR